MQHICVFCGSARGRGDTYLRGAEQVGAELARRGITVVYGGAAVGTMGSLADGALRAGGQVVGVIPEGLAEWDITHQGLTELHVVADMHQRKAMMAARSEAFIALPGGSGTLEELFEIWTWAHIGLHTKPIGLLNTSGYFTPLVAFLDHMTSEGFLNQPHRDTLIVEEDLDTLLARFAAYEPPTHVRKVDPVRPQDPGDARRTS